jgi:hypothetical protein
MVLFHGNRSAQTEVAGRQQFIAQSVPLEGFYREMVKALAEQFDVDYDPSAP